MRKVKFFTEKHVRVSELKTDDLIGFISPSGVKHHIVYDNQGSLIAIGLRKDFYAGIRTPTSAQCGGSNNIQTLIEMNEGNIKKMFVFDTHQELYKWLSED